LKIATIQTEDGFRSGIVTDASGSACLELFETIADLRSLIGRREFGDAKRSKPVLLDSNRLLPPIPNPGKLLCLAGNYREHIIESGFAAPEANDIITPQVFLKPSTCLIADGAPIPLYANNVAVGWEVELAVIIGRGGRNIRAADALDHVFGYTILNDISERKLNSRIENRRKREVDGFFDWLAGKWFDGFAPCGPWIVTADEIPDPHSLGIRLFVNGELRQESSTGAMLFDVPAQIEYISSITTLEAGDIISTGTPAGAGLGSGSKALKDGDEVLCEIDRIGSLRNRVKAMA
jgi:2-keto-4-pentenoate hydratase/2-oxohepta-3-ene-1,7-dioic acid hydratase in catechol pathway